MPPTNFTLRPAVPDDIPSISAIHKYYVLNTVLSFLTEPNTDDATLEKYKKVKSEGLPFLAVVDGDEKTIIGYCYVSPFRGELLGYRHTLELSLFCHPDHVRKGVGKALLFKLVDILEHPENGDGYLEGTRLFDYKARQLLAVMAIDIDGPGNGLKLRDWYLQVGFEQVGQLKEVGWKKERWIDVVWLQRRLKG